MTNKERYAAFCKRNPEMPIMMQPWWMDAVCAGKEWDVLLVTKSEIGGKKVDAEGEQAEDEIVAAMPYMLRKRLWYKFIIMPLMTQFGGVWMNDELYGSPNLQERLAKLIANQLRGLHIAYYNQYYPANNPMPFWLQKRRMNVEDRVTYCIDDLSDIEQVEDSFSKNKKRQLHNAEELTVDNEMSAEEFYRFHAACIAERGEKLIYSREFLLVLERKAKRAGASQFIRVCENGNPVAAAFVVWDRRYLYYLIPAYLPSAAKTGASARLADEAIRLAKEKGLRFDFEGGNDEGIANHYKQFGSHVVTYQSVSKLYRPSFQLLLWANKLKTQRFY